MVKWLKPRRCDPEMELEKVPIPLLMASEEEPASTCSFPLLCFAPAFPTTGAMIQFPSQAVRVSGLFWTVREGLGWHTGGGGVRATYLGPSDGNGHTRGLKGEEI